MLNALVESQVALDIIRTRGEYTSFGLHVRAFPYPENQMAVWIILAVRYKSG